MRSIKTVAALAVLSLLGLIVAGCGSSGSKIAGNGLNALSSSGFGSPLTQPLTGGKRGGRLEVLQEIDFEHLDPGLTYFSVDYEVVFATQRPLYVNKPNTYTEAVPDLASGQPQISADNKTVTVHLKEGIHYSPPVNREVTSEDVAYGIERGANPNIANPYIGAYFKAIEGEPTAKGGPMKGIVTPDKHTIVFHLSEPKAQLLVDAMVMPLTMAVPKEYAEKFDKHKPSDYNVHQVTTGPYMYKNDSSGNILGVGYFPGKSLTLVRNPNWNASSDPRPAYLDEVFVKIGGKNSVLTRQVLEGNNVVYNEPSTPQSILKLAAQKYKSQLEISPGAGSHYITVNNAHGPFKNINLRKAFFAALDRAALDKARGGELFTNVQTHFIYPGIPGFDQAGGLKGPKFDFNEHPEGSKAVADKYMKLAGYPSGKFSGPAITVVGATGSPLEQDAEIVNQTLKNLGFSTKFTLVETSTMYSKFCNVPKEEIDVCPSVGWIADFADPQTVLNITFNGKLIVPTSNVNQGQVNIPELNAAMEAGEAVNGAAARAAAWAKIDEKIVENAAAIPFDWDKQGMIEGKGVKGVGDLWDVGEWDYSWTSLK
jgi:peptide/nickel transport system substrate-binding protein